MVCKSCGSKESIVLPSILDLEIGSRPNYCTACFLSQPDISTIVIIFFNIFKPTCQINFHSFFNVHILMSRVQVAK